MQNEQCKLLAAGAKTDFGNVRVIQIMLYCGGLAIARVVFGLAGLQKRNEIWPRKFMRAAVQTNLCRLAGGKEVAGCLDVRGHRRWYVSRSLGRGERAELC